MLIAARNSLVLLASALPILLTSYVQPENASRLADYPVAIVFRIGKFDRSSLEFSSANPQGPVTFRVSKSASLENWYGIHPAALGSPWDPREPTSAAGPREIIFPVKGPPTGTYRLHLALLLETASVPVLKVGINTRNGVFYLHPVVDFSAGSFPGPINSCADVFFTFPASYLQSGDNRIMLEPIEESHEAVPDAGIAYDAIELDHLSQSDLPLTDAVEVRPTIFFQRQNGELKERVDVFVRTHRRIAWGSSCELTVSNESQRQPLDSSADFGDQRLEFLVPEFAGVVQAKIVVRINSVDQTIVVPITPKKKWILFVVPEIHLDVGYSDYQAKVSAIHSRTVDEAIDMMAGHPEFRFSLDGEWDLQQFLRNRSADDQRRAITAIQQGHLYVPAQYANLLTGIASTEALIRSLYPSADFSRKYGTAFDYANITDVPSYSWSYASILASAGIRYFVAGSDNWRAPVLLRSQLAEHSPMWWVGPDGQRVLLWYSNRYAGMKLLFGKPPLLHPGVETLPLYLQNYDVPSYRANETIVFGTQNENTDLYRGQAELAGRWNSIYAYPRLEYSGFHDALQSIEQQFGKDITTIRGDGGSYWEDGAASGAYCLAIERQNETRALTAEKLDTLSSLIDPRLKAEPNELGQMWTKIVLMDEHTWDSGDSVSSPQSEEAVQQRAVKEQYATDAAARIDFIARRSLANLAYALPANPGRLIVFNSLNWSRDGLASVDLPKGDELTDPSTGNVVPLEVLGSGKTSSQVQFMAQDIPPLGYKVYAIQPAQTNIAKPRGLVGQVLESPYYRVELDLATGAVRSIYDKELRRELVNQRSPYRFGEYVYVTGGDGRPNTMIRYGQVYPRAALTVHPAQHGRILSMSRTPFGEEAQLECQDLNTPSVRTEILLFDHEKKVELIENIDKAPTLKKEGVYFAFPFAMNRPKFLYEIQNGVVDPATDMYPGAGYTWFSVQHWISIEQGGIAGVLMPLEAPLVTFGDINRGEWPGHFGQRDGTVFSYIMNNYWGTNYNAEQGGHFTFRYIVTSEETTDPIELSRRGWNEVTPLETDMITRQDKAVIESAPEKTPNAQPATRTAAELNGITGSFINIPDRNVLLETWKPSQDGNGTILRIVDLGGTKRTVSVSFPFLHLQHVWQTDAVERDSQAIPLTEGENGFRVSMTPHEIVTIRVIGKPD